MRPWRLVALPHPAPPPASVRGRGARRQERALPRRMPFAVQPRCRCRTPAHPMSVSEMSRVASAAQTCLSPLSSQSGPVHSVPEASAFHSQGRFNIVCTKQHLTYRLQSAQHLFCDVLTMFSLKQHVLHVHVHSCPCSPPVKHMRTGRSRHACATHHSCSPPRQ